MKRLAKYLAQQCFRNTFLEDLHAGITPDSKTVDYTDVLVRSPYGEIPWPKLSRLSDEEMKLLMIDVVNKTYRALGLLFDDQLGHELAQYLARQDPLGGDRDAFLHNDLTADRSRMPALTAIETPRVISNRSRAQAVSVHAPKRIAHPAAAATRNHNITQ